MSSSLEFFKEGKLVQIDDLGSRIEDCLKQHTSIANKILSIEELQKDVYTDYLNNLVYLSEYLGNNDVLVKNIKSFSVNDINAAFSSANTHFMAITPGPYSGMASVTSGNYVKHLCNMLQVRGCQSFNDSLIKLGRSAIEGSTPDQQCNNVIGKATYNKEGYTNTKCYICNTDVGNVEGGPGCSTSCEHVLNVFQAMKTVIGLYNSKSPDESIDNLAQTIYKWSCGCCNYAKNQVNFITTNNKNEWIVNDKAIILILNAIKGLPRCCLPEYHKGLDITTRTKAIKKDLSTTCDKLNNMYSNINTSITRETSGNKSKIIKGIEFICVLSNITDQGITSVIKRVCRKRKEEQEEQYKKPNKKQKKGGDNTDKYIEMLNDYDRKVLYFECIHELNRTIDKQLQLLKFLYDDELINMIQKENTETSPIIQPFINNPIMAGGYKKNISKKKKNIRRKRRKTRRN
jgi:hypothetical protein